MYQRVLATFSYIRFLIQPVVSMCISAYAGKTPPVPGTFVTGHFWTNANWQSGIYQSTNDDNGFFRTHERRDYGSLEVHIENWRRKF